MTGVRIKMEQAKHSSRNSVFLALPSNLPRNQRFKVLIVRSHSNVPQIIIQQNQTGGIKTGTPVAAPQQTQKGIVLQRQTGTCTTHKNIVVQQHHGSIQTNVHNVPVVCNENNISNDLTSVQNQTVQREENLLIATSQNQQVINSGTTQPSQSVVTLNKDIIYQEQDFGTVYEELVCTIPTNDGNSQGPILTQITQTQDNLNALPFENRLSRVATTVKADITAQGKSSVEPTVNQYVLDRTSNESSVLNSGNNATIEQIKRAGVLQRSTKESGTVGSNDTLVESLMPSGGEPVLRKSTDGMFHCRMCQKKYKQKWQLRGHVRQVHTKQGHRYQILNSLKSNLTNPLARSNQITCACIMNTKISN